MASIAPAKTLQEWHTPSTRPEDIHELIHGVGMSIRPSVGIRLRGADLVGTADPAR